jgi:alkanesulfonate monooxygenase SsuD/methylene tetrahydromethanopterin reductase-like flavin-dependent oxidoreductase (luciferase family)
MGPAAFRRAGELGDGWHAVGVHADTLTAGRARVLAHAERVGRDPARLTFSTTTVLPTDEERAVNRLDRLSGIGLDHVVLDLRAKSAGDALLKIEHFVERIQPRLRNRFGG